MQGAPLGGIRLRVFGTSSDDKGTQLEALTFRLLRRLGYHEITANVIGSGGNEVDVRAEFLLPPIHASGRITLIAECKAHDSPITLTDWLKFLGKIYTEKARGSLQVRGILIALSGANGNVAGAVKDLMAEDSSVELITGERLGELTSSEFGLADVADALKYVSGLTDDPTTEISLGYYGGELFWIAEFPRSSYALLYGKHFADTPSAARRRRVL
jgi:Restriction endonuclease